jgi:hypothetical protein
MEFLEFLAADPGPIPIDVAFRETVREKLWDLLQQQSTGKPDDRA